MARARALWVLSCVPAVWASNHNTADCIPPVEGRTQSLNLDFENGVTVFNDLGGTGPLQTPSDRLDPPTVPGISASGSIVRFANIGSITFEFDPSTSG
eukprot:5836734-Prymnesium_polylepis.1